MSVRRAGYLVGAVGSAALVLASVTHRVPMPTIEVLGFVTGGWAVWLTVRENIWNWPIGVANSGFYVVVFLQARLYADASLQVVYIALGLMGWYWWLKGGPSKTQLSVSRTKARTALILLGIAAVSTYGMTLFLTSIHDSAPFLDAVTTVLSLVAQYMLTRKLFENWLVWITADIIYVGLYIYKDLYLTSGLYAIFLAMCIAGIVQWRRSMRVTADQKGKALVLDAVAV